MQWKSIHKLICINCACIIYSIMSVVKSFVKTEQDTIVLCHAIEKTFLLFIVEIRLNRSRPYLYLSISKLYTLFHYYHIQLNKRILPIYASCCSYRILQIESWGLCGRINTFKFKSFRQSWIIFAQYLDNYLKNDVWLSTYLVWLPFPPNV